jgi:tRNA pseudouridine38-40 synthase
VTVIRLTLAYDGTGFHGWARQPGVRTIEGELSEALARMLPEAPGLSVAGRTDAGVHATGQVVSFHAPGGTDPRRLQAAINAMLAPEVVVAEARTAPTWFDARHSARGREYRYRIDTSPVPDPFTARFVWHRPGDLSLARMRRAALLLVGARDFASFCRAPKPPASTVRMLRSLTVSARGHRLEVRAVADGFLHQMVRSLVGTLVAVGEGRVEAGSMPDILRARSRAAAGPVAPPRGLCLVRVSYGRSPRGGDGPVTRG